MTETTRNLAFPDELKQTVYELWAFECDRSVSRTLRRLEQLAPEEPRFPNEDTVRYWIRSQGWDIKADEAIASIAPNLRARQLGRLFVLGNQAIDTFAGILAGELDDQKQGALQAKVAVAVKTVELLGLGTAAGKGEAPKLAAIAKDYGDLTEKSPQELARLQREALLERKERR